MRAGTAHVTGPVGARRGRLDRRAVRREAPPNRLRSQRRRTGHPGAGAAPVPVSDPQLQVAGPGVAGSWSTRWSQVGSTTGPREGCRTRDAGPPPGRSAWLLSAPAGAGPGELGAFGGQLVGGPGRALRGVAGNLPDFP